MSTGRVAVWMSRLRTWALGVPVWAKIFGIGVGLTLLLSAQMIWHVRNTCRLTMERELTDHTQALLLDVATLAPAEILKPTAGSLQANLDALLAHHPEVVSLELLNAEGDVVARASADQSRGQLSDIHLAMPIHNGRVGSFRATVSPLMIRKHVNELTRQMLLIAAMIALLGIGAAGVLTRIIVRPIRELMRATADVRLGNLKARAVRFADDELGHLASAFNEMTQALEEKEAIRTHLLQRLMSAHEEERARIAQELHDELGQSLTSMSVGLKNLETKIAAPCISLCQELREVAVRTLDAAHDLAMALRPSALKDLGLLAALEHHAVCCKKRLGVAMDVTAVGGNGLERLPESIEIALYRIVQEAVTNSVKHGQAKSVSVVLQQREGSIITTIEDDGSGFDSTGWRLRCLEQKRLGLLGMEERTRALGGTLTVESRPEGGTTIYAELPVAAPALVTA